MLELRPKHWLTTEELRIKNEQLQQAETENQQLKLENNELQNQVKSLEIKLKHARTQKNEALQQLADVERENNILKDGTVLNRRLEQIRELEKENQQLRQQSNTAAASVQPDYEAIRDSEALRRTADRTLNKLKVGKQSTAGKAIDAFIKEIVRE